MAIEYSLVGQGNTLVVTASGFDESVAEVEAYGLAIVEAAVTGDYTRILCDETGLEYRLSVVDTYEAACVISEAAPRVARIALVSSSAGVDDARFWETVTVNRGLETRSFVDLDRARAWLEPVS